MSDDRRRSRDARDFNPHAEHLPELERVSALLFPACDLVLHARTFGDAKVYFQLPVGIQHPFALNDAALSTRKKAITQTWVLYVLGDYVLAVPPRFASDGGSIPWWAQLVWGYDPYDDDLWGYFLHDYICEHPELLPRGIGDAILGHLLEAIAAEKKQRRSDAIKQYAAVRAYTRALEWLNEK